MPCRHALWLALLLASAVGAQEIFDIKGITIGMPKADLVAKYPGLECLSLPGRPNTEGCRARRKDPHANMSELGLDTYAGKRPSQFMVVLSSGAVTTVDVELESKEFRAVTAALAERYGTPEVERGTVQNRMGASFDQETHTWRKGDLSIRARKRAAQLDTMDVTLISMAAARDLHRQRKEQAKDALKDL